MTGDEQSVDEDISRLLGGKTPADVFMHMSTRVELGRALTDVRNEYVAPVPPFDSQENDVTGYFLRFYRTVTEDFVLAGVLVADSEALVVTGRSLRGESTRIPITSDRQNMVDGTGALEEPVYFTESLDDVAKVAALKGMADRHYNACFPGVEDGGFLATLAYLRERP